jgi:hypothetical protein
MSDQEEFGDGVGGPVSAGLRSRYEIDGRLLWLLRKAGDEWGPLGVALTAADLLPPPARRTLIYELTKHDD